MIFLMRRPSALLRPFIEHFVYYDGMPSPHSKELLLPDGGIDLIIDLDDRPKHVYQNDNFARETAFRDGWISGMRMERITIQASSGTAMLVVRFKPGGAWPFFGIPMVEFGDQVTELSYLWGRRFGDLRERMLATADYNSYFSMLEEFFLGLGRDRMAANPFIQYASQAIVTSMVPPTIRSLSDQLGYSQKHMIAIFEKLVGISPKRYARIMRFQKMINALEAGKPPSWSAFALRYGFYDQAHFNNEFQAFAGMAPTRYLECKGEFINFLPVD